jgi:hypothetical protein
MATSTAEAAGNVLVGLLEAAAEIAANEEANAESAASQEQQQVDLPPPPVGCGESNPAWATASPDEKKRLLEACHPEWRSAPSP